MDKSDSNGEILTEQGWQTFLDTVTGDWSVKPPIWMLYAAVGLFWGCTNPFIKRAQMKLRENRGGKVSLSTWQRFISTLTDPAALLPYAVNQMGSVFFYYLSAVEPIQRAAPICNTLTFVLTALTAHVILKERVVQPLMLYMGVTLVACGIAVILSSSTRS